MKELYGLIDNINKGGRLIKSFIIVFQTIEYKLLFIFNIKTYLTGFLFFLCFLFCYIKNIKLYSLLKNYIIENIGILNFIFYKNLLLYFIVIIIIMILLYLYKKKTYEEFKKMIILFIYYRINFIINYNIFLKIFKINTIEFIEYNLIIILIFLIYIIILIIGIVVQNKRITNWKIIHYLNIPWISILYWIILFWNTSEDCVFISLYFDFRLKDFDKKYYDIIYDEKIETILIKNKKK